MEYFTLRNLEKFAAAPEQAPEMSTSGFYNEKVDIYGAGYSMKFICSFIQRVSTSRQISGQERSTGRVLDAMMESMLSSDFENRLTAERYLQILKTRGIW